MLRAKLELMICRKTKLHNVPKHFFGEHLFPTVIDIFKLMHTIGQTLSTRTVTTMRCNAHLCSPTILIYGCGVGRGGAGRGGAGSEVGRRRGWGRVAVVVVHSKNVG